jgi:hypothetical protein
MISTMTHTTAQIPSPVVMPTCASATSAVRDRKAVAGIGTGLVQGYFPGTSAWRPPTC